MVFGDGEVQDSEPDVEEDSKELNEVEAFYFTESKEPQELLISRLTRIEGISNFFEIVLSVFPESNNSVTYYWEVLKGARSVFKSSATYGDVKSFALKFEDGVGVLKEIQRGNVNLPSFVLVNPVQKISPNRTYSLEFEFNKDLNYFEVKVVQK